MSGLRIGGTPTARFSADLRSGENRSGAHEIEASDMSLNAANALQGVMEPSLMFWHSWSLIWLTPSVWRLSYRQIQIRSSKKGNLERSKEIGMHAQNKMARPLPLASLSNGKELKVESGIADVKPEIRPEDLATLQTQLGLFL
jgi:hypothetical protein